MKRKAISVEKIISSKPAWLDEKNLSNEDKAFAAGYAAGVVKTYDKILSDLKELQNPEKIDILTRESKVVLDKLIAKTHKQKRRS